MANRSKVRSIIVLCLGTGFQLVDALLFICLIICLVFTQILADRFKAMQFQREVATGTSNSQSAEKDRLLFATPKRSKQVRAL